MSYLFTSSALVLRPLPGSPLHLNQNLSSKFFNSDGFLPQSDAPGISLSSRNDPLDIFDNKLEPVASGLLILWPYLPRSDAISYHSARAIRHYESHVYSNFTTESVQYGIESEPKAVDLFVSQMNKEGIAVKVEEVGLLISKEKPYLGASLDRIVTFVDNNEKWGMEIKSPFSKAGMTVRDACKSKNFYLEKLADTSIQLKRNHDYYWQVQGQLYCSNVSLKGIIFTVYFGDNMPLFIENIPFHSSTWYETFLPKIDFFYRRAFFPR